jgi:excisionase family DNA binding protein
MKPHSLQEMQDMQVIAPDLLSARDVGRLLDLDDSTVYRMAADGRLAAVKIGRQWRFPAAGLREALERGVPHAPATSAPSPGPARAATPALPDPDVLFAVIDVAAASLGVMMLVTDLQGRALTPVANPCPWFADRARDPHVVRACTTEWRDLADDLDFEPRFRLGAVGFECARAFVRNGPHLLGMVLLGGVAAAAADQPAGFADRPSTDGLHHLDDAARRRALQVLVKVAATLSRLAGHGAASSSTPATAERGPA